MLLIQSVSRLILAKMFSSELNFETTFLLFFPRFDDAFQRVSCKQIVLLTPFVQCEMGAVCGAPYFAQRHFSVWPDESGCIRVRGSVSCLVKLLWLWLITWKTTEDLFLAFLSGTLMNSFSLTFDVISRVGHVAMATNKLWTFSKSTPYLAVAKLLVAETNS